MTDAPIRLLDSVAARDFAGVEACFAPEASLRVLTPRGLRELTGPAEAADRFRAWFGEMEDFELVDSQIERIADRVRIRWHTRGHDREKGWRENDHTGYAELDGDGLIVALNISCAGFRPAAPPQRKSP
jgi:hypothetical protein